MRRTRLLLLIVLVAASFAAWLAIQTREPSATVTRAVATDVESHEAQQSLSNGALLVDPAGAASISSLAAQVRGEQQARLPIGLPTSLLVVDEAGVPVEGAVVLIGTPHQLSREVLYELRSYAWENEIGWLVSKALSDADGRVQLDVSALGARGQPPQVPGRERARTRLDSSDFDSRDLYAQALGRERDDPRRPSSARLRLDSSADGESRLVLRKPAVVRLRATGRQVSAGIGFTMSLVEQPSTDCVIVCISNCGMPAGETLYAVHSPGSFLAQATLQGDVATVDARFTVEALGRELDVVLPPFDPRLELAIAGSVRDAARQPVDGASMSVRIDGKFPMRLTTGPDGRFGLWVLPGREVELRADAASLHALYAPETLVVAFGSTGVELRALPVPSNVSVVVDLVDAATGEPFHGASLQFSVRDGPRQRSDTGRPVDGRWKGDLPAIPGLELCVTARDHRDLKLVLIPAVHAGASSPIELRTEIERGFLREFRVTNCNDRTPVAGVEVLHEGEIVGAGDSQGIVRVELDRWPERLEFRAKGFHADNWPRPWIDSVPLLDFSLCPVR